MNRKRDMNIVMSSDNNYAQHLGISILSILKNKDKGYKIIFHILDGGISGYNKVKINQILDSYYECKINFVAFDKAIFRNFPESGHIKIAAYYRIMAPELIASNRLLYLDCDTIIVQDLYSLYSADLQNYTLAAIADINEYNFKKNFFRRIDRYFNSGVLLIDTNKWRQNNILKRSFFFLNDGNNLNKIKYHDQDILNHLLENDWLELDAKYNYQIQEYDNKKQLGDTQILHYISNHKPWHYIYNHPFKKYYLYYLGISPWQDYVFSDQSYKYIEIKKILHRLSLYMQRHLHPNIIKTMVKIKHIVEKVVK